MTSLSIGIVCVPSRMKYARTLNAAINRPDMTQLCCDIQYKGSWYGTRLAWEYGISRNTSHVMAIEEDVMVCQDFYPTVLKVLEQHPNDVLSLYSTASEKSFCKWARKNNSAFYAMDTCPSGQCVILPVPMAREFLMFCDQWVEPTSKYEDQRLWGFMRFRHIPTFTTVPNLVQHVGPTDSTLGFNNKGKVSPDYIGDHVSGLTVDFSQDKSREKILHFAPLAVSEGNFRKSYLGRAEDIPCKL